MPHRGHKLVVSSYRPSDRQREIGLWLLLVIVAFSLGGYLGLKFFDQAMVEKRHQAEALESLEEQFADLKQKWANADMATSIDRVALEQVRQLVTSLQSELAINEEELSLYRNLLEGGGSESGLLIGELMLKRTIDQQGVTYRLVVQQKERKLKRISVSIKVDILGVQDGKEVAVGLESLDAELDQSPIRTKFKYFHVVEGVLNLAHGFEPQALVVSVWKDGVGSSRVERRFDWRVDER